MSARPSRLLLTTLFLSLAAVAAALVSQHRLDMQPCPWCVLQRLVFVAMACVALLGLPRVRALRRLSAALLLLLAGAGAAAALWQHFVAASSTSCKLTLADRIMGATGLDSRFPEVFAAYATCADAAVSIAGIPYEFFSLALFAALGLAAVMVLRRPV